MWVIISTIMLSIGFAVLIYVFGDIIWAWVDAHKSKEGK
jgi:hypothetical protein